jgi:hypothetical protein
MATFRPHHFWRYDTEACCAFFPASDCHTSSASQLNLLAINDVSSNAIAVSDVCTDLQKALLYRATPGNLELFICSHELQCFLNSRRRWSLPFSTAFLKTMLMICRYSMSNSLSIWPSRDHWIVGETLLYRLTTKHAYSELRQMTSPSALADI